MRILEMMDEPEEEDIARSLYVLDLPGVTHPNRAGKTRVSGACLHVCQIRAESRRQTSLLVTKGAGTRFACRGE